MKKLFLHRIAAVFMVITAVVILSCEKEKQGPIEAQKIDVNKLSDADAFVIYQEKIAPLHSEGLEFVFKHIKTIVADQSQINPLTDQYMKTDKVAKVLASYDIAYLDESVKTEEEGQIEVEYLTRFCFDFVDKIHDKASADLSLHEVKKETQQILSDPEFRRMSLPRRHLVLTSIAIYEDSYGYWLRNLEKWDDETEPTQRASFWDRLKAIAKADLAGGVSGAISGAIAGSFAGGVGAGPGAVAGGVGGAVGSSVVAAF